MANSILLLALLVFGAWAIPQQSETVEECVSSLHELKDALLASPANMDAIEKAFFPVNRQAAIAVDVYYQIENCSAVVTVNNSSTQCQYKFLWCASAINLFFTQKLLSRLALHLYYPRTHTVRLVVPRICGSALLTEENSEKLCYNDASDPAVDLLNDNTARLKYYVYEDKESRGYSAFYYRDDVYCALNTEKHLRNDHFVGMVAIVLFAITVTIGTPAAIIWFYNDLYKMLKGKEKNQPSPPPAGNQPSPPPAGNQSSFSSNSLYFVWAIPIGTGLITILILSNDILTVIGMAKRVNHVLSAIRTSYIIGMVVLGVLPLSGLLGVLFVGCVYYQRNPRLWKEDFPSPFPKCVNCCCQVAGMISFTLGLQVISFHSGFMVLTFVTSPLHATAFLCLYSTAFFCTVTSIAGFLKVVDTHRVRNGKTGSKMQVLRWCCSLLLTSLFVFSIILFVVHFALLIALVGDYRDTSGFLAGFVGHVAPSVFLGVVEFVMWKIVTMIQVEVEVDPAPTERHGNQSPDGTGHSRPNSAIDGTTGVPTVPEDQSVGCCCFPRVHNTRKGYESMV